MSKYPLIIFKYTLLALISVCIFMVFIPKTYDIPPLKKRAGTQKWIVSDGSSIAYTLIRGKNKRQSYPILFLQGGPGGFITDRNIQVLRPLSDDGYDIYLYDQIGSGLSDRLTNINLYTAERHKKDLEEIIKKIGSEKVMIIAQSWGASLACLYIAEHPDKIEKLILTGPGPILPIPRDLQANNPPDSFNSKKPVFSNQEANRKSANLRSKMMVFFAEHFGLKMVSDNEADAYQTYLNGELNKATVCDTSKALKAESGGGFYAQVMTVKSFSSTPNSRARLKGLKFPVLLMKGQCDGMPWAYLQEYLELFPNHQLRLIPDAGHSISVEQPELYFRYIHEFLKAPKE